MKTDSTYQQNDTIEQYNLQDIAKIPVRKTKIKPKETLVEEVIVSNNEITPTPLNRKIEYWQTTVLIVLVLLVALSKSLNQTRFKQLVTSIFRFSMAQEVVREEKVFFHRANIWLTLVHIFTLSLLGLEFIKYQPSIIINYSINGFLLIVVFVICIYLAKYLVSRILFFVFDIAGLANEYVFNVSLYNNLQGILLLPVLMLLYFTTLSSSSIMLYAALPVLSLSYLIRLIRISTAGINYRISYLYIFLYICTLEILPLVVLYWIFIHK